MDESDVVTTTDEREVQEILEPPVVTSGVEIRFQTTESQCKSGDLGGSEWNLLRGNIMPSGGVINTRAP